VDAEDEVVQICREPRHQGDPRAGIQAGSRLLRWALVEAIQHQPAGTRLRAAREVILAHRVSSRSGTSRRASARSIAGRGTARVALRCSRRRSAPVDMTGAGSRLGDLGRR